MSEPFIFIGTHKLQAGKLGEFGALRCVFSDPEAEPSSPGDAYDVCTLDAKFVECRIVSATRRGMA